MIDALEFCAFFGAVVSFLGMTTCLKFKIKTAGIKTKNLVLSNVVSIKPPSTSKAHNKTFQWTLKDYKNKNYILDLAESMDRGEEKQDV